jgi:glucose/arabinose dehydrogenase
LVRALIMLAALTACDVGRSATPAAGQCDDQLSLPAGFCALVLADGLGSLRHIAVGPSGDVYVARWAGAKSPGGLVVLRDTNGDGRADSTQWRENSGGSGLALTSDAVYMATWTEVLRYPLIDGALLSAARPESIVVGLPRSGHGARSIVVADGRLHLNVGAPSNSCQTHDKQPHAPGRDPCPELERFAGVWSFDATRRGQRQEDGERIVTGVRHLVALAHRPADGALYAVQHGRDDLSQTFPELYSREAGERLPAEEMFRLTRGRDYGWPYCYYDDARRQKVLAPEYGGDGRAVGRCATAALPIFTFPAHWAPNGLLFYSGTMFPPRYRDGVFVAFHGAWYRPGPDNGFNVVHLPFAGQTPGQRFDVFIDGFARRDRHPSRARHRPVGLAEGPDGALYVTDDVRGRIWKVTYRSTSP